jgi:hypothetical protein
MGSGQQTPFVNPWNVVEVVVEVEVVVDVLTSATTLPTKWSTTDSTSCVSPFTVQPPDASAF